MLLNASRAESAQQRMHAVEAAQWAGERALPLIQLAMDDPNPAVRFAALVNVGRLKLDSLAGRAEKLAGATAQPIYVRAAAAYAAAANGREADLSPIVELLWHRQAGQRANAAILFGLLGDRAAVPMLLDAANDPMHRIEPIERELARLQIADALLQLGHEDSLKVLRGAVYSNSDEVRVLAIMLLGRAQDAEMAGNFTRLMAKDPIELRLAAAEALARIGNDEGLPLVLFAADNELATVRSQAAFALAQMSDRPKAQQKLTALLDDPDPMVRIAAAAGVLQANRR
jgi:HEAT repeat protein